MEYVVGSLVTLAVVVVVNIVLRVAEKQPTQTIRYSQSHIYSIMKPILDFVPLMGSFKETQASKYLQSLYIRVMVLENEAFWIKDNALYTANLVDGEVDKNTTRKVDTMTMNKVELEKTMFIVEKLREGQDHDNGSTGKPKF